MFDMAFVTDLCDNHVNDCLRVAQTVALESAPPNNGGTPSLLNFQQHHVF